MNATTITITNKQKKERANNCVIDTIHIYSHSFLFQASQFIKRNLRCGK
jgi:hypothetical protein